MKGFMHSRQGLNQSPRYVLSPSSLVTQALGSHTLDLLSPSAGISQDLLDDSRARGLNQASMVPWIPPSLSLPPSQQCFQKHLQHTRESKFTSELWFMFGVNSGHVGIIVHSTIIYCVSTAVLDTEATLVKRTHQSLLLWMSQYGWRGTISP